MSSNRAPSPSAVKPGGWQADDKDEFYLEILDGLARYLKSSFVADLVQTVSRFPEPYLAHALNKNQVASKGWLIDELYKAAGGRLGTVYVLAGWKGVLAAMLLYDERLDIDKVLSIDMDPACEEVADTMNATNLAAGRFKAVTGDMYDIDYRTLKYADGGKTLRATPGVVINCSCEHLDRFGDWFARIPDGTLLAMQSNDFFSVPVHVNCVPSLAAFKEQAPLGELLFEGELKLKRYTRFMLIGRR